MTAPILANEVGMVALSRVRLDRELEEGDPDREVLQDSFRHGTNL